MWAGRWVCQNQDLAFVYLNQHVNQQVDSYIFGCLCCRYVLEGKELEFYQKKIHKKKGKGAAA
jgi:hypothetical protein